MGKWGAPNSAVKVAARPQNISESGVKESVSESGVKGRVSESGMKQLISEWVKKKQLYDSDIEEYASVKELIFESGV